MLYACKFHKYSFPRLSVDRKKEAIQVPEQCIVYYYLFKVYLTDKQYWSRCTVTLLFSRCYLGVCFCHLKLTALLAVLFLGWFIRFQALIYNPSNPGVHQGGIRIELLFLTHSLYAVNSKVTHCDCVCCLGYKSVFGVCVLSRYSAFS